MELTVASARQLIDQTLAELRDFPDPETLCAVSNRLLGMYEMLKVIPSFKASRYHPHMFPDAVAIESMLGEAIEEVTLMLERNIKALPDESSHDTPDRAKEK